MPHFRCEWRTWFFFSFCFTLHAGSRPSFHPTGDGTEGTVSRTRAVGLGCRQPPLAAPSINLSVMRWALRLHPPRSAHNLEVFFGFSQSPTLGWAAPLVYRHPDGLLPVTKINSSRSYPIKTSLRGGKKEKRRKKKKKKKTTQMS